MYQRWIEDHVDHGVVHGTVRDVDDDRDTGAVLWGIEWDDGTKSDYTLQDMQNYCVSNKDGAQVAPPLVTAIDVPVVLTVLYSSGAKSKGRHRS